MSEDQSTPSVSAAKAARRAAIAVAPPEAAPEAATEAVQSMTETAAEVAAEAVATVEPVLETASEAVEATVEAVMEAVPEPVVEPVSAPVLEAAAEPASRMFALFEPSARGFQALAEASTTMAKGAEEASRAWLDAAKTGAALQREGMKQIVAARSVASLVSAYSDIARRNMETFVDCTQKMTRMSLATAETAGKMLRAAA